MVGTWRCGCRWVWGRAGAGENPHDAAYDIFMCLADRVPHRVGDLADDSMLEQVGHVRERGFAPLCRDAADLSAVGRDGGAGESIGSL